MESTCAAAWILFGCAAIAAVTVLQRARELSLLRSLRQIPSIIITGAAHGIGKEIASQAVKAGISTIVLLDLDHQALEECKQTISVDAELSQNVYALQCDVAVPEQVQRACSYALTICGGHIDVLVSNAGIAYAQDIEDVQPAGLQRCYGVNIFASFYLLQQFLPVMKAHRKGCVVLMSSIMSMIGSAQLSSYVSSKFALRGLGECLRMELARDGFQHDIPVITACPYATRWAVTPVTVAVGISLCSFLQNWNV
jgi:3alpha(or 20beta)-hydroxysteroid dehydrogenase